MEKRSHLWEKKSHLLMQTLSGINEFMPHLAVTQSYEADIVSSHREGNSLREAKQLAEGHTASTKIQVIFIPEPLDLALHTTSPILTCKNLWK